MIWLAIGIGGAAGAIARFAVERITVRRWGADYPFGTLIVNLIGSLLLGFFAGLGIASGAFALLGTGLCGALTTFSGFAAQVLDLEGEATFRGIAYAAISLSVGVTLVGAGLWVGTILA